MTTPGKLSPPGPIESTALCSAFASAKSNVACTLDDNTPGTSHFDAGGITYPLRLFAHFLVGGAIASPEETVVLAALNGQISLSPDVGLDPATDPDLKGSLKTRDQLVASRHFELNQVINGGDAGLAFLAIRAFAFLAGQVIQNIAELRFSGDWNAAYLALLARGFTPPDAWRDSIAPFYTPDYYAINDHEAWTSNLAAAYNTAFHGLLTVEADPVLSSSPSWVGFQPITPVTKDLVLGAWEAPVRAKITAKELVDEAQAIQQPDNGDTFVFQVIESSLLAFFAKSGLVQVGTFLAAAFDSLGTAWAKLEAEPQLSPVFTLKPLLQVTPSDDHGCQAGAGEVWDPVKKTCVVPDPTGATGPTGPTGPTGLPSNPGSGKGPTGPTGPAPEKAFPWGWVLGGAAALAAVGTGVVLYRRNQTAAPETAPSDSEPRAANPVSKIRWDGLKYQDSDLVARRRGGLYDVVHGVDGWVVLTPRQGRWAFNGTEWTQGTSAVPTRGKMGAVSRDQARKFAELLIAKDEHPARAGNPVVPCPMCRRPLRRPTSTREHPCHGCKTTHREYQMACPCGVTAWVGKDHSSKDPKALAVMAFDPGHPIKVRRV